MNAQAHAGRHVTAVVIGGGQAGLATSCELTRQGIDHVVLERGEVGNSWRRERWDSLRLLTPNWQSQLPGFGYNGDDPDGFMDMAGVAGLLDAYAAFCDAPVHCGTRVTGVEPAGHGYRVSTELGDWRCRAVVLANGPYNVPVVPALSQALPGTVRQLTPHDYRNPSQLEPGGVLVVGAAATGMQIAAEIQSSGRQVTVAVGEHLRLPRHYRGRDIQFWMHATGLLDEGYRQVDDLRRVRALPSPQLSGQPGCRAVDINALTALGVQFVGRLAGVQGSILQFSGALAHVAKLADLKQQRLLSAIDAWLETRGAGLARGAAERPPPTRIDAAPRLAMDLSTGEIRTVIWATGFRPDYSWLKVPVLDRRGRLSHDGGVTTAPGLFAMGLPFMRRRKSGFIWGVGDDAAFIAARLSGHVLARRSVTAARVA